MRISFAAGLDIAGACPECGTAIQRSAENFKLNGVLASWFTSVRIGLVFVIVGIAVGAVEFVMLIQYRSFRVGTWWYTLHIDLLVSLLTFLMLTSHWWGVQLVASARPRINGHLQNGRSEQRARLAAHFGLAVALVGQMQLPFVPIQFLVWNSMVWSISIWGDWTLLNVIAQIGEDINRHEFASRAIILRNVFAISLIMQISAGVVYAVRTFDISFGNLIFVYELLVIVAAFLQAVAACWCVVLAARVYRRVGALRRTAPIDLNDHDRHWVPRALRNVGWGLRRVRAWVSYSGNRE